MDIPNGIFALDTQDEIHIPRFTSLDPEWCCGKLPHIGVWEYNYSLTFLLLHPVTSCSKYILEVRNFCCHADLTSWKTVRITGQSFSPCICQGRYIRPFIAAMIVPQKFYCVVCCTYKSQTNLIWWMFHENLALLCKLLLRKIARFQKCVLWNMFNISCKTYALTFMHHASYIHSRRTATPQSTRFIYLVNRYIT